jgi:hypothetical protein
VVASTRRRRGIDRDRIDSPVVAAVDDGQRRVPVRASGLTPDREGGHRAAEEGLLLLLLVRPLLIRHIDQRRLEPLGEPVAQITDVERIGHVPSPSRI